MLGELLVACALIGFSLNLLLNTKNKVFTRNLLDAIIIVLVILIMMNYASR